MGAFDRYAGEWEDFEDDEYYEDDERAEQPEVIRYGLDWGWFESDCDLYEPDGFEELDPPYGAYDNERPSDDYIGGYVEDLG